MVSCRWIARPRVTAPSGRPVAEVMAAEARLTFTISGSAPAGKSRRAPTRLSPAPVTVSTPPAGPTDVAERAESTKAEVSSASTPLPIVTAGGPGTTASPELLSWPPPQAARTALTRRLDRNLAMAVRGMFIVVVMSFDRSEGGLDGPPAQRMHCLNRDVTGA